MKIIDLLNKIANGEDVPKKIKYDGEIYEFKGKTYENTKSLYSLFEEYTTDMILNDEVEIIEEDKKIEKIDKAEYNAWDKDDILDKINEIIDKLNKGE